MPSSVSAAARTASIFGNRLCAWAASSAAESPPCSARPAFNAASAAVSSEIGVADGLQHRQIRRHTRLLQRGDVLRQLGLIADRRGQDHRRPQFQRQLGLDTDGQRVQLEADLVAAVQFALVEHAVLLEQLDGLGLDQLGQRVQRRLQVRQAALGGLDLPVLRVAVTVEHHRAVLGDDVGQQLLHGLVEVLAVLDGLLQNRRHVVERIGHDRVEHDHRHRRPSDPSPARGTRTGCR